ncbi:MAG TPA: PAS domain S-box protein, partial [Thermoguttaceae bacterium]|nr:PAS domain S-box protein [Thermoguttaceae bacterium]
LLLWAAVRFGPRGACCGVFLVTVLSIRHAVHGRGPFTTMTPAENVLSLQMFLAAVSVPLLFLTGLLEERRQTEEELRRIEHIVSGSTDMLALVDENYVYLAANGAYLSAFGKTHDELIGHTVADIFGQEVFDATIRPNAERCLVGEEVQYESWIDFPGAGRQCVEASYSPYISDEGPVNGFVVCGRIVTNRKQAEETLKRNEYYLSRAQQIGSIGTWELDIVNNALIWTDENYRIFGVPIGTPLNYATFLNCVHPEDRQYVGEQWTRGMNREPYDIEHRLLVDGKVKWVREKAELVFDANGDPVKAIGFTQDTTERKRAEKQLQESEQRFRTLVEYAPDGIFLFDANLGKFIEANPRVQDLLGYTRDEVLQKHWMDISAPIQPSGLRAEVCGEELVQQALAGAPVVDEWLFLTPSGEEVLTELRLNSLTSGNRRLLRASLTDITERKRAEQERERLITKLEAQNAELERFTYTVSHDLKSPLITIQGYAGVLREDLAEGNSERVEHDLARISEAAGKMNQLLNDLLELSRVGRLVNPPEDVSLAELAQEMLALAGGQIKRRGVEVEISPNLPVVFGDRLRLGEVLQNLIDNAAKYMGDQPQPRIEVGSRRDGNETICYVRDNGIGIDHRYHEKVFGLFDQLDPNVEGSGIGLSLVKRIVEVHGGRIWVESEGPGHGSTFCFSIPAKDEFAERPDDEPCTASYKDI